MARNTEDEIRRLKWTIAQLTQRTDPPLELVELIQFYQDRLPRLERKAKKAFIPYRNEYGELVLNQHGDTDQDL